MDKLFGDLKGFFKTGKCVIDSFIFRLHYRFTLVTLIAFSIAVTGRQYIGDPIDCISRDDIPNELLDTYCWIHTTFSVDSAWFKEVGKEIPYPGVDKHTPGEKRVYHAYYQWVCFVLFLQAMLFYIPRYLWKNIESHKLDNLVMKFNSAVVSAEKQWKWEEIQEIKQTPKPELKGDEDTVPDKGGSGKPDDKQGPALVVIESPVVSAEDQSQDIEDKVLKKTETKVYQWVLKENEETVLLVNYLFENRHYHYFYATAYCATVLLNFINVVGQIFLMDVFLGGEFTTYGTKVLAFSEWEYTLRYDPMIRVFPRMTKCTFHRYGSSGDVQKHDAMCLIPINILNEKIYIFLWFWFIILAVLTGLELTYRIAGLVFGGFRRAVLRNKCRKVFQGDLDWVLKKTDQYDWMVLNMLCDNLTPCNFKILLRDLAKRVRDEHEHIEELKAKLAKNQERLKELKKILEREGQLIRKDSDELYEKLAGNERITKELKEILERKQLEKKDSEELKNILAENDKMIKELKKILEWAQSKKIYSGAKEEEEPLLEKKQFKVA